MSARIRHRERSVFCLGYQGQAIGRRLVAFQVVPISERIKFSLQAEFLNVFNHPNWGTPNSYIQSSTFGQAGLSNLNGSRLIELRANITF